MGRVYDMPAVHASGLDSRVRAIADLSIEYDLEDITLVRFYSSRSIRNPQFTQIDWLIPTIRFSD